MAGLSAPIGYAADNRRAIMRVDWPLIGAAAALIICGLMSLYSVGQGSTGTVYFRKQILFLMIGLVPFSVFAFIHPDVWRKGMNWLYILNLLTLLAVFVVGKRINGAERWILLPGGIQFQPSEMAKLLTILTLSAYYADRQDSIQSPSTFIGGLFHIAVPVLLIKFQPHLGAALVVLVMWGAVSIVAGVPLKYIGIFLLTMGIIVGVGMSIPAVRGKLIDSYQDKRVRGLTATKKDVRGKNWQTDRAEIAFGVGGVTGAGFGHGEQKQAGFIPEQHNDFILTVVGEEGGLMGCALLLATFGFFFYRVFLVMLHATEPYYRIAAAGVFAVLGFHTVVNIAMVLQLVPVVGLWLPFMSYGGTALWLCMSCLGLLLGIRRRERPLLF